MPDVKNKISKKIKIHRVLQAAIIIVCLCLSPVIYIRITLAEFFLPLEVITENGPISITDVKVGMKILGRDGFNEVVGFENIQPSGNFYAINGDLLLYEDQSIYANGRLVHVKNLQVGDKLISNNGQNEVISLKQVQGSYYFYRLTIGGDHTYYLNGILVHNASRYWVKVSGSGTGNWDKSTTTDNWSESSGGAGGATAPGQTDDAIFDENSFGAGDICTADAGYDASAIYVKSLTSTNTTAGQLYITTASHIHVFGDITLDGAMSVVGQGSGSAILERGTGNVHVDIVPTGTFAMGNYGSTSSATLTANLNLGGTGTPDATYGAWWLGNQGAFDTNSYTFRGCITDNNIATAHTLTLSGSTIYAYCFIIGTGLTLNMTSGTLNIYPTTGYETLNMRTKTFYDVNVSTVNNPASTVTIAQNNTFNNLTITGDKIAISGSNTINDTLAVNNAGATTGLVFTNGTTQTVSGFTTNGSAGNLAKILSNSAGSAFTLSKASGKIFVDYTSIKDSAATGGALWYAKSNSVNVSGNSGWIFVKGSAVILNRQVIFKRNMIIK